MDWFSIMSSSSDHNQNPNANINGEQNDFSFIPQYSQEGWEIASQSPVQPDEVSIQSFASLTSGGYTQVPFPALDNFKPSYTSSSKEDYTLAGTYQFEAGSPFNTPDNSFAQTSFDPWEDQLSNSLSENYADNFDTWPTDMYGNINLYTNMLLGEQALELVEGEPMELPQSATETITGEQPDMMEQQSSQISRNSPLMTTQEGNTGPKAPHSVKNSSRSPSRKSNTKPGSPSRRSTHSSPTTSPAFSPSSSNNDMQRVNHNQIEKRYRTSMNARYQALKDYLPGSVLKRDEEGEGFKKVGKADVLTAALKYVKELEDEKRRLLEEQRGLVANVGVMEQY
jgi:hypothetical protein